MHSKSYKIRCKNSTCNPTIFLIIDDGFEFNPLINATIICFSIDNLLSFSQSTLMTSDLKASPPKAWSSSKVEILSKSLLSHLVLLGQCGHDRVLGFFFFLNQSFSQRKQERENLSTFYFFPPKRNE